MIMFFFSFSFFATFMYHNKIDLFLKLDRVENKEKNTAEANAVDFNTTDYTVFLKQSQ